MWVIVKDVLHKKVFFVEIDINQTWNDLLEILAQEYKVNKNADFVKGDSKADKSKPIGQIIDVDYEVVRIQAPTDGKVYNEEEKEESAKNKENEKDSAPEKTIKQSIQHAQIIPKQAPPKKAEEPKPALHKQFEGAAKPAPTRQAVAPQQILTNPKSPTIPATTIPTKAAATYNDPKNFDELVAKVVDMGFDIEKAKNLLRTNNYNVESAANQLLDQSSSPAPQGSESSSGGLMVSQQEYKNQMQLQYNQLSATEKQAVDRLKARGYPFSQCVEMYIVSGKDEQKAISFLKG